MRNLPVDVPGKLDLSGSIVYCVALTLIMFGFSSLPAFTGVIYMVLGIAGFFAFGLIELKVKSPILDIRIFRGNYPFIFSNLAELIAYSATFALGFLLSIYLQSITGMSPGEAGLTMVIQTVLMVLLSKSTGSLSDKVDPAIIAAGGMAVTAVGLGTFIFLTPETPVWWIIVCMGIVGVGLSFFISPITNAVMSSVEKKDFGLASATLGSMRTLGMNFSMGIILMLFTINHVQKIGRSIPKESFEAFLKTTKVGFTIFAVLCLFAILSLIIRGRVRERAAPESGMPESGQKEAAGL